MAFHLRAFDGLTLNLARQICDFQGIRTSIAKKPYILDIFQGGGPDPPLSPSGSAHVTIDLF